MNYYRSCQKQELPEDGISLLMQYMDVASNLVPLSTDESTSANVLWHPDLHLDNIFVDPDTHQITRIVDWQSACVAPLFYHSNVPRLCRHPRPVREGWVVSEPPTTTRLLETVTDSEVFIGLAKDDGERELFRRLWPYQESFL